MQGFISTQLSTGILMTLKRGLLWICIVCLSCKSNKTAINIDPTWVKHNLPNGWTIFTPAKFTVADLKGIDSQPGYISSSKDSILLNYDTGTDLFPKSDACDFSKEVQDAKFRITNQEEDYTNGNQTVYNLRIDTINGKVAIIKAPDIKGSGQISISIKDCKSGAWIGVRGEDLSLAREIQIIKIFETIRHDE